jgi:hypothetical protein
MLFIPARAFADDGGTATWINWVAWVLFLATLLALIVLGSGPNMLRDPLPEGAIGSRPFSLGKVQMAWWFIIVVGSYLYIWSLKGSAPELSPTLLSLMGISGATGTASMTISATQQTQFTPHSGFFQDLVTDKDGVTLHRFQMLTMTIVLGIMFIIRVASKGQLPPDFDGTTLGLMGISSGTYLGCKIPEKQS